jgi:4-hydroxy-4-methyl-2-oxoglutarate aldolase
MSKEISNEDVEIFQLMKTELYSPVLGDVLDSLGYVHQILPQPI